MSAAIHHALWALSCLALLAAGLRLASWAGAVGATRLVAAAPLAAASAAAEALALGLVDLGGRPVPLAAAAFLTWLAARAVAPAPMISCIEELHRWWVGLGPKARLSVGAAAGVCLVWLLEAVRTPTLAPDGMVYHLTTALTWVQNGSPGSSVRLSSTFPVESYPLTHELLLAWTMGLSRSFVPATVLTGAMAALGGLSAWVGLRTLAVRAAPAILAATAFAVSALTLDLITSPGTDLPAVAWLATCAALCAAATGRVTLLAPAIVAAGLAAGSKPTTAPLVAVLLALGVWNGRAQVRAHAWPLILATALAAVVGGLWYARNLVEHGSPLWPFYAAPWGDPVPEALRPVTTSLLDRPFQTLFDRAGAYRTLLDGSAVLLAGGVLAGLVVRTRATIVASALTAGGVAVWAVGPATGRSANAFLDVAGASTIRYLLPAVAAGAAALALASASGVRWQRVAAVLTLALAAGWNVAAYLELGTPEAPGVWILAAGALAGAGLVAVARVRPLPRAFATPRVGAGIAVLASLALALLLSPFGDGYVERSARSSGTAMSGVAGWFAERPASPSRDVLMADVPVALLAGDRLVGRVGLLSPEAPCGRIRALGRDRWIVLSTTGWERFTAGLYSRPRVGCLAGREPDYRDAFFAAYRPPLRLQR